jgi:hypothetical protein
MRTKCDNISRKKQAGKSCLNGERERERWGHNALAIISSRVAQAIILWGRCLPFTRNITLTSLVQLYCCNIYPFPTSISAANWNYSMHSLSHKQHRSVAALILLTLSGDYGDMQTTHSKVRMQTTKGSLWRFQTLVRRREPRTQLCPRIEPNEIRRKRETYLLGFRQTPLGPLRVLFCAQCIHLEMCLSIESCISTSDRQNQT